MHEALWKTLEGDPALDSEGFRATIKGEGEVTRRGKETGMLPSVGLGRGGSASDEDLHLVKVLGEGGMGVVHLAEQRSLGREVAVKTLKPGARSHHAPMSLLREAMITGGLEHPNVIPVHALGISAQGLPVLVMKRVEGVSWDVVMGDETHPLIQGEPLMWHLRVLMQVCNAIHFAHSKGVVHRDLKPENIMIGHFGEVYVMDWGIAFELDAMFAVDEGASRGVVGTPAYMAPEMTRGPEGEITPKTDVYLLGALLHEILAGAPLHQGPSIYTVLLHALESYPRTYGPEVPEELGQICNKATAAEPVDRYDDAQALGRALQHYVLHRDSWRLSDEASEQLGVLEALFGAEVVDEDAVARAFGACRFGFQQALSIWPENRRASEGLRRALVWMIEHELEEGNARQVALLLGELPEPDEGLRARLGALERRLEAEREELDALRARGDSPQAARQRMVMAAVAVFPVTIGPFVAAGLEHFAGFEINLQRLSMGTVLVGSILFGMMWLTRKTLRRHPINYKLMWSMVFLILALITHRVVAWWLGITLQEELASEVIMIGFGIGMVGLMVEAALGWLIPLLGTSLAVAVFWPEYALVTIGLVNMTVLGLAVWIWHRKGKALEREKVR